MEDWPSCKPRHICSLSCQSLFSSKDAADEEKLKRVFAVNSVERFFQRSLICCVHIFRPCPLCSFCSSLCLRFFISSPLFITPTLPPKFWLSFSYFFSGLVFSFLIPHSVSLVSPFYPGLNHCPLLFAQTEKEYSCFLFPLFSSRSNRVQNLTVILEPCFCIC